MIVYEVRKEVSRDNGETLDKFFCYYNTESAAHIFADKMNAAYRSTEFYVREVEYDNSTS